MAEKNILGELWKVALTLLEYISVVFEWLFRPLKIAINIPINIPVILENGIKWSWNIGITPISLLGVALVGLVIYWMVWA